MKKSANAPKGSAQGVKWNLSDLYKSVSDPKLKKDCDLALKMAAAFEKKYKGKIAGKPGLNAAALAGLVDEFQSVVEKRDLPHIYANLLFAGDTQDPANGRLLQEIQNRSTEITKHLIFWELEWCEVDEKVARKLMDDKACVRYRHYLSAMRRYRPHLLSEPEEKIIDELENTGSRSFSRLFDEMLGGMKFTLKIKGKNHEMSEQEALALLHDPDRATREAAAKGLSRGFQQNLKTLTFIFNTLAQHHSTIDRLRQYPHSMASRNLANEIDKKTVDALLAACDSNTHLVARYYKLKAGLLGLKTLYDYDRYAPISAKMPSYSWKECEETMMEAYSSFSPECGKIVGAFFKKHWMDAELRPGKRGGAFCCGTSSDLHPYILANYTDKLRDAITIAHELGHGIHMYLAQKQGYLQIDTPLTLAETASVFGEMLAFHSLMEKQNDSKAKLGLLCGRIEDAFATVFRQACMTRFEQKAHEARRKEGELTPEALSKFWMEVNQKMFKDSVKLTDGYSLWWCYIPHFIHTPFYCYAYSFGQLLVLSLYARYRKEGKKFVPKYLEMLAAGGSESPEELTRKMGLDITKPSFWNEGLKIIEEMIGEAERLAKTC